MSESRKPPRVPPTKGEEEDDGAPTLEIVEGDADEDEASATEGGDAPNEDDDLDLDHEPTTEGLGFDAVGFLAGGAPDDKKRTPSRLHAQTGQGLGFDPVAHMLGLAPGSSAPPSAPAKDVEPDRRSSRAPEQPRQTLPTRSASQKPERPALRKIPTQDFDPPASARAPDDPIVVARARYAEGDVVGALTEAEAALAAAPGDEQAQRLVTSLRQQLERTYEERLAPLGRVVARVAGAPITGLDHDARFLLAQVDGKWTIAQVLDGSEMTRLDAMRVLEQLIEKGIVRIQRST